jgi:hypothetical protein
MMKCAYFCLLIGLAFSSSVLAQEMRYQATGVYETNDLGQILSQGQFAGWLVLAANGTYRLDFNMADQGQYQYIAAGGQLAQDTIFFVSNNLYQFFAYPQGDRLAVWLQKTSSGTNRWVSLQRIAPSRTGPTNTSTSSALLPGQSAFKAVVMYGTTSAPSYYHYNPATGHFDEDQKGIIFRPDGTFYLRADFGDTTIEEEGDYHIEINQVRLTFSDGSSLTLTIEEQGSKLHWYSGGMLISEFFYLGEAK